jgi:hypothetical protein
VASPLRFHPEVSINLAEAVAYYESKSLGWANRFKAAVKRGFLEVKKFPNLCPLVFGDSDVRFKRLGDFPYLILFRITPRAIELLDVVHSASDPEKWRSRSSGT